MLVWWVPRETSTDKPAGLLQWNKEIIWIGKQLQQQGRVQLLRDQENIFTEFSRPKMACF